MSDRSSNPLVSPGFAANPPLKLNIDARILGLVIAILAVIGALLTLFAGGLLSLVGFGSFAPIWLLGVVVALVAEVMTAIGGFQMYGQQRKGRNLVIYGLAVALAGALLSSIGQIIAYSGLLLYSTAGPIVSLVVDLIVYGILYYLVVISRFPGDAPLVASAMGSPYMGQQPYGPPPQYTGASQQGGPSQYGPPPPPPAGL